MIKPFFVMAVVLFLMIFGVGAHYILFDDKSVTKSLSSIVGATQLSQLSLSVSYYEPRLFLSNKNNIIYPEMMPINRMDFVYAK